MRDRRNENKEGLRERERNLLRKNLRPKEAPVQWKWGEVYIFFSVVVVVVVVWVVFVQPPKHTTCR